MDQVPSLSGSKAELKFDQKYSREQRSASETDFEYTDWLTNAGVGTISNWKVTKAHNNVATRNAFESPRYQKRSIDQLAKDGLTPEEILEELRLLELDLYMKLDFMNTRENPSEGAMVVKEIFNKNYDVVGLDRNHVSHHKNSKGENLNTRDQALARKEMISI
ncbi:hypothetical protein K458DRAFT_388920 [Lentithecium fluviatile CBS 122367]|uniref:Uncharacterized protein n=1 Tax=Lentithecium fluviatile CBS 122367 TaxID=1168545 RepID=A0A6G1J2I8_9PLEO|nr:hypothetical protein K458DRAFT_388920 [Lentithecium fluviatile CBS 122367]